MVTTMWLEGLPAGETDWDRFAASWPVPFDALAAVVVAAWDETDPVLLELCRLRMATLLAYPAEQARRRPAPQGSTTPRSQSCRAGPRHRASNHANAPAWRWPSSS